MLLSIGNDSFGKKDLRKVLFSIATKRGKI